MNRLTGEIRRVLTIEPTTKGFGYAVLEGPENLIDWGTKEAPRVSNSWCLAQATDLLDRFHLDLVVVEDTRAKGSRRSARVTELLRDILSLARRRGVQTRAVSRRAVRSILSAAAAASTKHDVALHVAQRFPELAPRMPPRRRPWSSEDRRMAIFTAVALGLAVFEHERTRVA